MQHKYGEKFKDAKLEFYTFNAGVVTMVVDLPSAKRKFTFIFRDHNLWISNGSDNAVFFMPEANDIYKAKKMFAQDLKEQLTNSLNSYSKASTPFVFPSKRVEREVRAWLKEKGYDDSRFDADHMPMLNDWNSFDDLVDEIVSHFSYERGFNVTIANRTGSDDRTIEFDKFMNNLIPDYATQIKDMGITINPFYIDAVEVLRLGLRQLERSKHANKR